MAACSRLLRVRVRGFRPDRVWVRDSELVVWQARVARTSGEALEAFAGLVS